MRKWKSCGAGVLAFLFGVQSIFTGLPAHEVKAAQQPAAQADVKIGKDGLRDRGVVAINLGGETGAETKVSATDANGNPITSGVYVSWRSFEEDDFDGDGRADAVFDVYRNDSKLASGITVTNLVDPEGKATDTYRVVGSTDVVLGIEAKEIVPWQKQYLELDLCKPEDETVPLYVGKDEQGNPKPYPTTCTYTANDMSVGQLDGDGSLDLIVKWDPNNSQDNSSNGYTGKVFLDGYRVDWNTGETKLLWRIDMGVNIRAGAHYTQYQVWDFDGDGIAEIAVKTADGTTTYKSADGTAATLKETGHVGKISADKQRVDVVQGEMNYDYRNGGGRSLTGDEYFTIFNGEDGTILDNTAYIPDRGNWTSWGDDYGNRSERYLSATGYVMGEDKAPAALFGRGYYTRIAITAFYLKDTDGDGIGDKIDTYWAFDTMKDGGEYEAQGNHGVAVNDVDGDGCDELIYGSLCIDHDGKVLWSTGLQHGDAMHVSDWIPDNPGLEIMQVHEDLSSHMDGEAINVQVEVHDAATGKLLMGYGTGGDTGRGLMADIDPTSLGGEWYAGYGPEGIRNTASRAVFAASSTMDKLVQLGQTGATPAMNFSIFWDGDLLSELYDGADKQNPVVSKWNYLTGRDSTTLFATKEALNSNGTKNNAGLVADIFGDWREEVIVRSAADASKARVYATTIQTDYVVPCLLEDLAYREAVAWQNVGYNQPANTSYLVSEGVVTAKLGCVEKKTTNQQVVLKFAPASDGVRGHEISGYHLYRAEVNNGTVGAYELLATLGADAAEYTDTSVTLGKSYAYQIAAVVKVPQLVRVTGGDVTYREEMAERDSYLSRPLVIDLSASADKVYAETVYYGDASGLPETETIKSKAGDVTTRPVSWGAVDTTKLGTQTVQGVAEDYEGYVEAEVTVDYRPTHRFDIGIVGGATPEGWTAVNTNASGGSSTTEALGINYTAERGYGFLNAAANFQGRSLGYDTAGIIPSEVYRDYAMVGTNSFVVDVPEGSYKVDVICSGTSSGSLRTNGTIEGESFSISCGKNSYGIVTKTVNVTDGQLTLEFTGSNFNCVAGIIVRPVTAAGGTTAATDVKLGVNKMTAVVGEEIRAAVKVLPANASDQSVTYTVTKGADVAAVNAAGVITGKSAGTATVRAALTKNTAKYAEVTVTFVEKPTITGLKLDVSNLELETGKKHILTPSVTPAGSKVTYKYKSSDANVATVSASGEITALAVGSAEITCEVVGSTEEAVCKVKVVEAAPDISTLTAVDIPKAAENLVYIYKTMQVGVPEKEGYTVKYGKATYPGTYNALCTLEPGYKWSDNTVENKVLSWSIDKAMPDLSKVKLSTINAVTGQKLSQLALPGSPTRGYYHWKDDTLSVGDVGTHEFEVYFVPINEQTEKVVYGLKATVKVTARTEALKEFTVTVNAGEGGSVTPAGANKVTENDDFTFTVTPRDGYEIEDVKVGGVSLGAVTDYTIRTVTEDITVEVSFAEVEHHTVTATAGAGGKVTPESKVVNAGGDATFTIVPDAGYEVADVKVDGISVGKVTSYTVRHVVADVAVEVAFQRIQYIVAFASGVGGKITVNEGDAAKNVKVFYGDSLTFVVVPDSGYEIEDLKVNGVSVGSVTGYTLENIKENVTVEAAFRHIQHQVTFRSGTGGKITVDGSDAAETWSVSHGDNLTFAVVPDAGYAVADVKVDGNSVGKVTTYTLQNVTADKTVEAAFAREEAGGSETVESETPGSETGNSESAGNSQTPGSETGNSEGVDGSETTGTETVGSETPGSETGNSEGTDGSETTGTETVGSETPGSETGNSEGAGSSQTPGSETPGSENSGGNGGNNGTGGTGSGGSEQREPLKDGDPISDQKGNKYVVTGSGRTVEYTGCTNAKATDVTVPDTVEVGGISYQVTSIGAKAFYKKTKLKKVTIGKNVQSIGKSAFEKCTSLKTVTFKKGSKCKKIGASAFKGDKALTKITLPNSVQKLDTGAFASCTKLASVTIGTGLKTIGASAFSGDSKLKTLTINSKKLNSVGKNAFKKAKANLTIKVPKAQKKKYASYFKKAGLKKYKLVGKK